MISLEEFNMNYRDILGLPKKEEKKVTPKEPKDSVADLLKEEFGPLHVSHGPTAKAFGNKNQNTKAYTGPKRWSGSGMTEYEQGQLNEENFAAQDFSHKINKCFTNMVKAYNEFNKKGGIKNGSREDREITNTIKMLDKYKKTFDKLIRKLI